MKTLSLPEINQTIQGIERGNGISLTPQGKKVRRKIYYVASLTGSADITPDGRLIEPSTKKEIGRTNFDNGNKLNEGRSFLVTGIRMVFDSTAAVDKLTATYKNEAPAAYKNGELKISQEGSGDLFNNPISAFVKNDLSLNEDKSFEPVVPFLIRPNVPFDIQTLTAGAAAAGIAVRLELDGLEYVDADKA